MDLKNLRSRIDTIKKQDRPAAVPAGLDTGPREIPPPEAALLLNGWRRLADMVYEKVTLSENPLQPVISDFLMPEQADTAGLFFYDTETTGLGGAGNIVFLTGFGFTEGDAFKTVQIMLTDFPGEPAFLEAMKPYISPERIYVSYNGRAFDANILKSRYALNGMRLNFGYQLDLLYPSRRLWRNVIGSCSLGDIEEKILKKERELDVPGAMVPDLYFDFMRSGDYAAIEGVAAHHLEDIKSLAELLSVFEKIAEDPVRLTKVDRTGLASQLTPRHPETAEAVLEAGFKAGSFKAAKELGLLRKRRGDYDAARGIWENLWESRRSIFAGIELAKQLEHREKDIEKAHSLTCELLSLDRIRIKLVIPELERRRVRLELKLLRMVTRSGCIRRSDS
ncbi:MAG: ribonuclease H-like domain-containing protein [Spirochaetales bacterium]|nr:ribonuclease H-like domain-containing protein [Spirochaetales bacterium]